MGNFHHSYHNNSYHSFYGGGMRPFRGRGVGEALMKAVLERAKARGMKDVHLAAQVQAMPFYERLGFEPYGDAFDEAGIAHRMMRREV